MKIRSLLIVSFLCLFTMISGARAGSAQQVQPLEPEWLQQMYAEGWEKVQEGVLQRDTGEGQFESFSYGAEGLQWVIEGYVQQLDFLEERYNESPSEDLAAMIDKLQGEIGKLSENLEAAPPAETLVGTAFEECQQKAVGGDASAGPLQSPQGITATATAYFQNACSIIGDTAAFAYADAIDAVTGLHDTHNQDDPSQGAWIDSSATANAVGSTGCSSWAQASVTINGDMVFQTPLAQSSNCSLPVLATITGPATATADYYINNGCVNVTWTASATQGNPGYTYNWYIGTGTTVLGTGSTFTQQYCNTSTAVMAKVVVRDSDGHTAEATKTTTITHTVTGPTPLTASISGPDEVWIYQIGDCRNISWTASATGGTPAYTFTWYLGTNKKAEGTGSTFTKMFCGGQMINVRVIARDAAAQTDDATFTTVITACGGPGLRPCS